MIKIKIEELISKKSSDTIFILGSGSSINKVTSDQWSIIGKHDSIAFNWFCKHEFEPKFFLIREQSNIPSRCNDDESPDILVDLVNKYKNTHAIICNVNHHTKKAYKYYKDSRIKIPCLILKDNKSKKYSSVSNLSRDPSKKGLIHGSCTLCSVLHLVKFMGYKNIVFVGIDLYDSRYFWLRRKKSRHTLIKKGVSYGSSHPVANKTKRLVGRFCKYYSDINVYVANKKSLLKKVIKYKSIEEFA